MNRILGRVSAASLLSAVLIFSASNRATANTLVVPHVLEASGTISPSPDGGIVIGNIGSSGQDGVSIDIRNTTGFATTFGDSFQLDVPVDAGASLRTSVVGIVDGAPGVVIVNFLQEVFSDRIELSADFSGVGAPNETITIRRNGVIVLKGSYPNGQKVAFYSTSAGGFVLGGAAARVICEKGKTDTVRASYDLATAKGARPLGPVTPALEIVLDGVEVEGDEVSFTRNTGLDVNGLTSIKYLGTNPGGTSLAQIPIKNEAVQIFDRLHTGLGEAQFVPQPGSTGLGSELVVSNIGSSGQDGVSIDLGLADSCAVSLAPIDPGHISQVGSFVEARIGGIAKGVAQVGLGVARFTNLGLPPAIGITADFSGVQSPTQHLQIISNGILIADFPDHSGPVGISSAWPDRIGKLGGRTECIFFTLPPGSVVQVDGAPYPCDEMLILSEGPELDIVKTSFALLLSGITSATLTEETVDEFEKYFGLNHRPLGMAELSEGTDRNLDITNIGSSGQDGVQIDMTGATGWSAAGFSWGTSPPSSMGLRLTGTSLGGAALTVFDMQAENVGDNLQVQTDFSGVGALEQTITILQEGVVVASALYPNNQPVTSLPNDPAGKVNVQDISFTSSTCEKGRKDVSSLRVSVPGGALFDINGLVVAGNEVRFARDTGVELGGLTSEEYRAASAAGSPSSVTIDSESIMVFDLFNTAEGQAWMSASMSAAGQQLLVHNLGSSGQDGVSINLGKGGGSRMSLEPITPAADVSPNGASFAVDIIGQRLGVPDQLVAYVNYTKGLIGSSRVQIDGGAADVCEWCPLTIQVLDQGVVVGQVTNVPSGPFGDATTWPLSVDSFSRLPGLGAVVNGLRDRHPAGTTFGIGGTDYVGDELRFYTDDSAGGIHFQTARKVQSEQIDFYVITDLESTRINRRAFGDFTDDGCTDLEDFLFLLDNWQVVVDSTIIGLDDFLHLLDNWQSGFGC